MFPRWKASLTLALASGLFLAGMTSLQAQTATLTPLHSFANKPDGALPVSPLVQGGDGNFYGTTGDGGLYGNGTVFEITPGGTLTILHSFKGSDGIDPEGGLILATDGNFYGTTSLGGASGKGTAFKITPTGTLTVLRSFNGSNGAQPAAALLQASDGNLYGTTQFGGAHNTGTVFKMTLSGTLTVLYSCDAINATTGANYDGAYPVAALVQGKDGNFYSTMGDGGANGDGTVFKITPAGAVTVLHTFNIDARPDGAGPEAPLLLATDGNFYGTTILGGASGKGTIFKITPGGTLTILHSFAGSEGANPYAGLIQSSDGDFYGTCSAGGAHGKGTLYQITPDGTLTDYHDYTGAEGAQPMANLIQGFDGNLYGTTQTGGAKGWGTVFRLVEGVTAPVVISLSPDSTDAGEPSFLLTVNGSNFVSGAIVKWNGGALTTTFLSATQLSATVPSALIATPGTASVTVVNPDNTYSNTATFTINNPIPVLSSVGPSRINAGGPNLTLSVKGKNLISGSTVNWNGTPLSTTFVSATQLKAVVPAALTASPGTASVTIVTPAPGGGTSIAISVKIVQTTLQLVSAALTRNSTTGVYTAVLSIKNTGYLAASSATIAVSSLGAASTSSALPVSLGSIAAGASAPATLTYPTSAGTSGSVVTLKVTGKFTGGTFSGSMKVTLP